MSGGVDSSVTALLLKQQGYEVVGIAGKMTNSDGAEQVCKNARAVADKIGIPLYILDLSDKFKEKVIDYLINLIWRAKPQTLVLCAIRGLNGAKYSTTQ